MSLNNGMTPQQALNYLENLGIIVSNGRAHHDIASIQAVAVLRPLIPDDPKVEVKDGTSK